jgi:hypothetical protein
MKADLVLFLSILALAACAQTSANPSGFLDEGIALRPSRGAEDASVYLAPTLADHRRFHVEPVVIRFHPAVAGHDIDPVPMGELANRLRSALVDALGEYFIIADGPGPGVVRLRVAVTDLYAPGKRATDLDLPGAVPGVTAVEALGTDSASGKVLFAARGTGWYERLRKAGTKTRAEHVNALAAVWAEGLNHMIDEAHAAAD